jgi:hypothetical protein
LERKENLMKYLKMLGLVAAAALALMALLGAGAASATKLCKDSACTEDYAAGTSIEATLSSGTTTIYETTGGTVLNTCSGGAMSGKTNSTSGAPLSSNIASLTWLGCTRTMHTIKNGSFSIEYASGVDGSLSTAGTEVTINTIFGSCVYGPAGGLNLGTLKGGSPAVLEINTILPRLSGPCPSEWRWTAKYTFTSPKPLYVGA